MTLTGEQVERFVADGFVKLEDAFSREVGQRCRDELWTTSGCDPRFMAQPPLHARTSLDLDEANRIPVARSVRNGLSR